MRVLLAQNMLYLPAYGGANKSNRILLEELAARGHTCWAVAPMSAAYRRTPAAAFTAELAARGIRPLAVTGEAVVFDLGGVEVHAVVEPPRLARYVARLAARAAPDWTLVPSDDPGGLVLAAALHATPGRVVYLAHTLQQLPFGPRAFYPSVEGTRMVRRAAGVVTVSRAAQDYLLRWGGLPSALVYPHVYGKGPYPGPAPPDRGAVTMVNPCAVKGIAVFLALADAFPTVPFMAVPTWGTSAADRAALARRPNVRVAAPADDIGQVLAETRILLMPSLWDETFGYTCVEAMLRGIPVLAAEVGGLAEAKLGVPYLLRVQPIRRYVPRDDRPYPEPVVPEQDVAPWREALGRLLRDPAHHQQVGRRSQAAAGAFVGSLDPGALDACLRALRPGSLAPEPPEATPGEGVAVRAGQLTPERRTALARLLAARRAASPAAQEAPR